MITEVKVNKYNQQPKSPCCNGFIGSIKMGDNKPYRFFCKSCCNEIDKNMKIIKGSYFITSREEFEKL